MLCFVFDIEKAIAATAYVLQKRKLGLEVLPLVKVLYHANRECLVKYGRSITGDKLVSMKNGPNVSQTYDLIKGSKEADETDLAKWRQFFSKNGHMVILINPEIKPAVEWRSSVDYD